MNRRSWACSCRAINEWIHAVCESCGAPRQHDEAGLVGHEPAPRADLCAHLDGKVGKAIYAPDGPGGSPRGLCSSCHFEQRIKPYASKAEDVCLECSGQPPHRVREHLDEFRRIVQKINSRNERVRATLNAAVADEERLARVRAGNVFVESS